MRVSTDTKDEFNLEMIGDNIDRLITLGVKRASVLALNEAAREAVGGSPSVSSAQRLSDVVRPMDTVVLITGAIVSPFGTGETDGPMGAAALARSLALGMKASPIVFTPPTMVEMARATCRAAGLNVITAEELARVEEWMRGFVAVEAFPIDDDQAVALSARVMDVYRPVAVISIESTGPNSKGVYHNYGRDFTPHIMKAGRLFEAASSSGVLTIGIGDRGNEIGFGGAGLHESARDTHPYGEVCRCPCEAGAADTTQTDVTVVATVSNWGAYGVQAALAAVTRNREGLHNAVLERRMLHACTQAGGVDGRNQTPDYLVDSLTEPVHVGVAATLEAIVTAQIDFAHGERHDPYGSGKY